MAKLSSLALIALVAAPVVGCGESAPQLVEVEGTVTLNGQPLDKIRVEFWPFNDGPQSAATTDAQGKFALTTWDGAEKGAILSKHKVVLRDNSVFPDKPIPAKEARGKDITSGKKPRIADKYSNATITPLEIELTGERHDLVFDVEPYAPRETGATRSR